MKPFVKAELLSQAPLIPNSKDTRPSQPSEDASSSPRSDCNTTDKCKVFSAGHKCSYSPTPKDCSALTKHTGQHFLFDKRWRNGIYTTNAIADDVVIKQNFTKPLPYPEFHVYRSHNLNRFAHCKEFSMGNPKPLIYGADYLTSFPSVLLPAITPSVSERIYLSQNYKNRSRMKNRARNLFTTGAKKKTQSYPDPLLGATASFVQRLSDISSLEAETVRQEKMRRLKKINRQDS
ncbi:uncharacterized protein [Misgurnus anguillicaudatus]|uniref:uncharacterized protein isoform X2 n=1 Tax=Misgurnus anguillicaudatus TaxID=75329 RepID=UPI003CCF4851